MLLIRSTVCCVLLMAFAAAQIPFDTSGELSSVSFTCTDQFGNDIPLRGLSIELTSSTGEKLKYAVGSKIKFGSYLVVVSTDGFGPGLFRIKVSQKWHHFLLAVRFGGSDSGISVRVSKPIGSSDCTEALLVPLFCDDCLRLPGKAMDGKVFFSNVPSGQHIAVFRSPTRTCGMRVIMVNGVDLVQEFDVNRP